jgi:hypothetical protein
VICSAVFHVLLLSTRFGIVLEALDVSQTRIRHMRLHIHRLLDANLL